ncbi:hypothetical protein [Filimonas effusa]|uniref:DUF4595 domain-containing protein n=1 Tax=Filimonas effusa TaxID=2508721 RepID=A0A4Q1DE88_9BACT|nr:hypothetical protein [Filimonas effusa]RXK87215.1 hypothetical protein ESB13_10670 [Filimonas effusa]
MNRRYLLAGICIVFSIVSCQKGIEWDLSDEEEVDTGVLSKIGYQVSTATGGTETSEKQFFRDAQQQLTEYSQSGKLGGQDIGLRYRFTRNTNGKVVRMAEDNYPAATNISSIIRDIYYTGDKLAYMLSTKYTTTGQLSDSTAFVYGSNGLVSARILYNVVLGTAYAFMKDEFTYDGQLNLVSKKMYTYNGTGYDLNATVSYTYGTNKASLRLPVAETFITGVEAQAVAGFELFSSPGYMEQLSQTGSNGSVQRFDNYMVSPTFAVSERPLKIGGIINGRAATITYTYKEP